MKSTFSISEIVGTAGDGAGELQFCATADAAYDAANQEIRVALDAFARHVGGGGGAHVPLPWLPRGQQVKEHLPRGDASAFTREVFDAWVRKVRAAIPEEPELPAGVKEWR